MVRSVSKNSKWPQLWAKTNRDWANKDRVDRRYHPLLFHMLDVAAVADLVLDRCFNHGFRQRLECSLGPDAYIKIVFMSGVHDIGKAIPGFQKKEPELSQHIDCPFSKNDQNRPHGFVSAHVLRDVLGPVLAQIAGGHHGIFPRASDLQLGIDTLGNNCWENVRQELLREFAKIVDFKLDKSYRSSDRITDPSLVPILAGFVSVVDWIGSNQDFFPCVAEYGTSAEISSAEYWKKAQGQARKALERLGWLPAVVFAAEKKFDVIFGGFVPNVLQNTAMELVKERTSPYLMIIEAPMGQGKTETALYTADLAMCRGFARGMYVAMPTQATSNAMFRRILDDYLRNRGHQGKLNLQLVHGDALLAQLAEVKAGEIQTYEPQDIAAENVNGADVEAQSWFTAKKRPLLAPFGVGTIDQSLLSVLQTRHWFVRLFGLSGKVLIFDEVHAYDAYMSTIFERLLNWLAEVNCIVILLSATLPETRRKALVKAYSGRDDVEYKRYPRITLAEPRHYPDAVASDTPDCAEIFMDEPRTVSVHFLKTDMSVLTENLSRKLKNGGCAAVICNTVDRSIGVYKQLSENLQDTDCSLFHARTLQMWRREREEEVLSKFGKGRKLADGYYCNEHRPPRAVLVATQVIEQSLDLDFDLMFSEIAPVDLLLQRCGRLHRHPRRRPTGLETPKFILLCDAETSGNPPESFGKSIEFVYDRYVLLRTWLVLRGREKLKVPIEIESLVEAVYGESLSNCDDAWKAALEEARQRKERECSESERMAGRLLVGHPEFPDDLIEEFNNRLDDEDDPEVHRTVRAATREGDPSITVVMLPSSIVHEGFPGVSEVRAMLDRSAKLSHRGLFQTILRNGERPPQWANSAHLRYARLLRLDEHNQGRVGDFMLKVDEKLGVIIERDGENNG